MRGKGFQKNQRDPFWRITPAYAGKRYYARYTVCCIQDHPRLCGEKICGKQYQIERKGSPPPMRGKGGISRNVIFHCRITPAYAEKRSSTSFKISSYQDHPRLCGEKRTECYTKSAAWGSPPPMRGKVAVIHWFAMMQRITPAYAGKRRSPGSCTS